MLAAHFLGIALEQGNEFVLHGCRLLLRAGAAGVADDLVNRALGGAGDFEVRVGHQGGEGLNGGGARGTGALPGGTAHFVVRAADLGDEVVDRDGFGSMARAGEDGGGSGDNGRGFDFVGSHGLNFG